MARMGDLFTGAQTSPGFLGLPQCQELSALEADIAIIGAPIATPYACFGTYAADSPGAIRNGIADFKGALNHFDFDFDGPLIQAPARVFDCGDIAAEVNDSAGNRRRITGALSTILDAGAIPVVLGGDDSVPIPVFQAFKDRGPFTVLQIDAHIDWRDEVDGERMGLSSNMRRASEMGWIDTIVQVGARGMGSARPSDYADALALGAKIIPARELHARGIEAALEHIPPGAQVLVNVDCDGLDPAIMPAVIGPAPGGLDYWQVVNLLHGIAGKASIAGFNIVEFMPSRDTTGLAALTAGRLVCTALGLISRA